MKTLELSDNEINEIPTSIILFKKLKELNLKKNKLTEYTESMTQLNELVALDIEQNKISRLPESFGDLNKLKVLSISNNELTQLPNSLGLLKNLESLHADYNQLIKLPNSIGNLSKLNRLYLDGNQLEALPKSIGLLSNLYSLFISNNKISQLPDSVSNLSALTLLALNDNKIIEFPHPLLKLPKLALLALINNKVRYIPENITNLKSLHFFKIHGNPLTKDLDEVIKDLSSSDLITYLLEIQREDVQPLNEAKILVLGDERVGKTSIVNRLIGREMSENEKSTLGIDIQQHRLKTGVNVNIWDFAGQEITHQTHKFFLSSRSLYLYVLDAQKEDNDSDVTQWLNTIKTSAGDSPIIIVVNKSDLNPSYQFDTYRYQQDFNILDVLYVSAECTDKIKKEVLPQIEHSITDLIDSIEKQVSLIEGINLPFPPSWLAVKKELEVQQNNDTDFIESSIYEHICNSNGLKSDLLQNALLSVLNQIGTVVTYKGHSRLNIMQIINPSWVTTGVYKVLRSSLISKNKATLNQTQFKEIFCGNEKYKKQRHYTWLIDLLKQFQLAFSINKSSILIPSRLESTQPDFDITEFQKGLNFRFKYSGLLKKGVLAQFIVLMHEYITSNEDKYWQRGVFLEHEQAQAVVISDEEKKTITIAINQSNRSGQELLTIIRHCIRRINGQTLEANEEVPVLVEREIYGFTSYVELLEAEEDRDDQIRVSVDKGPKKSLKLSVSDLLNGYRIKEDTKFDYKLLARDLFDISCIETENRHAIFNENEDLTNDRFRNALLNRKYKVSDQSRGGESGSRLSAGERDLLIRNSETNIAECVIEAFVLKNHNKVVIESHIKKLINNYDTTGNKYNYAISYVKSNKFNSLWDKYKSLVPDFHDTSDEHGKLNIFTGQSTHGSGSYKRYVNHIFINFYPEQQIPS